MPSINQWAIYRATLDPVLGSEQRGTRPVVVISHDDFNHLMPTVTILPMTSQKPGRRLYPNEVLLPAGTANLPVASLVLIHQIRTVAQERLSSCYGVINDCQLQQAIIRDLQVHLPYGP